LLRNGAVWDRNVFASSINSEMGLFGTWTRKFLISPSGIAKWPHYMSNTSSKAGLRWYPAIPRVNVDPCSHIYAVQKVRKLSSVQLLYL